MICLSARITWFSAISEIESTIKVNCFFKMIRSLSNDVRCKKEDEKRTKIVSLEKIYINRLTTARNYSIIYPVGT